MYEELLQYRARSRLYENVNDLYYNLDSLELRDKIRNILDRYEGMFPYKTVDDTIDVLRKDFCSNEAKLLLCQLVKDPKKQNIFENEFFKFVNSGRKQFTVKRLPQTGKKAIVFDGCKAIDFKIEGTNIIGTQKYTKGVGGAQDNQLHDVINSLNYAKNNPQYNFIAVLNGDYYTSERMESLRMSYSGYPNIRITNADDFKDFLDSGCKW